jgi:UrcA family protein
MNMMTFKPFRTVIAGAIFGALAVSISTVSGADERTRSPQVIVKFADLDVSTSQGAEALYGRIHSAAVNVCWRMHDSNEEYMLTKDVCLQKVIADAVINVNKPALLAVFTSKYGVSAPVVLAAAGTR